MCIRDRRARVAHVNADWPADFVGDGARGASDHDPLVARFDLPATLAQVQDLLAYYASKGLVDAKTAGQLQSHLDKAAERLAAGNRTAYRSQLQAFVGQARDKLGAGVTQPAGAQLIGEAQRLLAA